MSDLERGTMQVGVNTETLKPIINDVKQMVNRVVLGIYLAITIITTRKKK